MSIFREWVTDNPMRVEVGRLRRKYLTFRGANSVVSAGLALFLALYLFVVLIVWLGRGVIHPNAIVMLQTLLIAFLGPVLLHTAIAGEREARSWELLLCAPVTTTQIVAGKILGALGVLVAATLLFLVPIALAWLTYNTGIFSTGVDSLFGVPQTEVRTSKLLETLPQVIVAELLSLSFALVVCAVTVFFSGRCRRALTALGLSLGFVFLFFGLLPTLVLALGGIAGEMALLSPLFGIGALMAETGIPTPFLLTGVVANLFLALAFIVWTSKTLVFADNQVGFLPKANRDA